MFTLLALIGTAVVGSIAPYVAISAIALDVIVSSGAM